MNTILERMAEFGDKCFIVHRGERYSYQQAHHDVSKWLKKLPELGIKSGDVVSVIGQFSLDVTALLLALLENKNIIVPIDDELQEDIEKRHQVAGVQFAFRSGIHSGVEYSETGFYSDHDYLQSLRKEQKAGLILFTSGSTGNSKAAVHQFDKLIGRYFKSDKRKPINAMVFLKFDHIGGVSTMLSILMNGGCMFSVEDRSPESICRLIEREKIQVLPTTPSFLNMLIMSRAWEKYDLSSIRVITYGTEPMPESTLNSMSKFFPDVMLKQTYGLTELGIFPTRSKSNTSTFMSIKEGDIQIKIKDDILYVKSDMAMLGYLNAPSPFDEDGWYNTGDKVIVEDGYTKILGRDSEIINVGGEKVYPSEVESVLLDMRGVKNVVVQGKKNPITGQIVSAVFELEDDELISDLARRVREHCQNKLDAFKIPREVAIADGELVSGRFKKIRKNIKQKETDKSA
ncbi:long-chain fatty acid--CoA ligase [Aliikangiella maris]|uniref:Long-chain fatty acid--CoA ligase n=2 Tax=Aliikangiella maris TaxID=3162458 RepID=A0ABV3MPM6_9GAMM